MNKSFDEERSVTNGVIELIRHKVFYGHILSQLSKVMVEEDHSLSTFAVGKKRNDMLIKLYANRGFIKKLQEEADSEKQYWNWIVGILEHEVLHIVFDHLNLHFADKTRGNIAVDLVVNSLIQKEALPKGCFFPDMFDFEKNKSATWYYENLEKNEKYRQMCKDGQLGVGGLFSDALSSHGMWAESTSDPFLKEVVKDIIRKSKDLCNKSYDNIPREVIEHIEDALADRVSLIPWNRILRQFVSSAMESNLDYTMKRISKRYGTRPGVKKEDVVNLAIAIDTSGSISNKALETFNNEIRWIWKNGALIHVYEADMAIAHDYVYKGVFPVEVHGRGGTDLEPVLKEVEGKYDALIYFTDFYAPKIETRYYIPTLWVLTSDMPHEEYPYKWGKQVKIDIDESSEF